LRLICGFCKNNKGQRLKKGRGKFWQWKNGGQTAHGKRVTKLKTFGE